MLVSVIIPTYNRENTIERAVNSVLNQTYKELEVIVVDDCSTDMTKNKVVSINDSRVRYVRMEYNKGACAARNYGIELSRGDYIAFQDSDDEWVENKLKRQMDEIKNNNADIIFCSFKKIANNKIDVFPKNLANHFCTNKELVTKFIVSTQTILMKKKVCDKYKFDVDIPRMQDYDFIIRASKEFSVYYLNEILVNVYEQSDSITAKINEYNKRKEITKKLLNKYGNYRSEYPEWEVYMLKVLAHCYVMMKQDSSYIYKYIYKKQPTIKNFIMFLLSSTNILYFIFKKKDKS